MSAFLPVFTKYMISKNYYSNKDTLKGHCTELAWMKIEIYQGYELLIDKDYETT